MKISNLPGDLAEEVLSRTPLTTVRRVRSTCKKWNKLSKCGSFAKKHLGQVKVAEAKEREFTVVMMMDLRVYLMSVNLHSNVESCIKREGKLISLDDSVEVDISKVFHCNGLLLCIPKDNTGKLVVWNPYLGQTQWIEHTHNFDRLDNYTYAIGYDKKSNSHKILRFVDFFTLLDDSPNFLEFKIYDFKSGSWKLLDITPDWRIEPYARGVSLKGNTYWIAKEKPSETREGCDPLLVCFDFTNERFGPPLPVPFELYDPSDTLTLSSVREEQLAVLFQQWDTLMMEIWITTKIEPHEVSWNSKFFLKVNMRPLTCFGFQFLVTAASFFIDEEKKVVVVFDKEKDAIYPTRNVAYIVGADGSLKEADLGESADRNCYALVCSYVPSSVQLN